MSTKATPYAMAQPPLEFTFTRLPAVPGLWIREGNTDADWALWDAAVQATGFEWEQAWQQITRGPAT